MIITLKYTVKYILILLMISPTASIALNTKPPIHDPKPEPFGSEDGGPLGAHRAFAPLLHPQFKATDKTVPHFYFCPENINDDCECLDECCDLELEISIDK